MRLRRRVLSRARRIARRFFAPKRPTILMYHRIARESFDPWGLAVSPKRFEQQLDWLAAQRMVLPLADFADRLRECRLPNDAIAITFDDGYACNGQVAAPLLAARNLPATVFLCPDLLDRREECWWDDLERIVLDYAGDMFVLDIGDGPETISLGARYDADRHWRADAPPTTLRQSAFIALWSRLRPLEPQAQRQAIEHLRAQASVARTPRDSHRLMAQEEIRASQAQGMTMGAHSLSHTALDQRSTADQAREIIESRARCAEITGYTPACFAYPYGDLNDDSVRLVEKAGYSCACTTENVPVGLGTSLYRLPRIRVGNWSCPELGRVLSEAGG
jgi:peptidoglycan/xylan/chitin deacetylase (PgdA/CDA1 family)